MTGIEIDIKPVIIEYGQLVLTWHGFYSFVAVAVAVVLVGRWAPTRGVRSDDVYSIATWAIVSGVIGARLVHVIDDWTYFSSRIGEIPLIWGGGMGIWGGVLGGFLGGVGSAMVMNRVRAAKRPRLERAVRRAGTDEKRLEAEEELAFNQPLQIGVIADLTAPALLLAQTIGRIGDIINGEHCAKAWDSFLAFVWTNPASDAGRRECEDIGSGIGDPVHPAIAYEMIWNMIALAIIWKLRNRLMPPGMVWAVYLVLYSIGRFLISFSREDGVARALGMQEAHYIALLVLAITIPVIIVKGRLAPATETASPAKPKGTRAERRRRAR